MTAERALTDLELERWLAGDLPEDRMRAATGADRARLEGLRAEHAALLGSLDVAAELRGIRQRLVHAEPAPRPRLRWRWALPAGMALAAAAAVLLVVARRDAPSIDELQTKGDRLGLVIHVASGASARRAVTGDTVQVGDRLRFEVGVPGRGYIAVVGIDGSGAPTVYYPPAGRNEAAPIEPGAGTVLPGAIALDATPGDERFYLLYAAQPFALDAALLAGLRGERAPGGVSTVVVSLKKKPARF